MSKICIMAAPGFFLKTGYFFRVMRDREMLRNAGHDVEILVATRKGLRSEKNAPIRLRKAFASFHHAKVIVYENIAPAVFSFLRPRSCQRDIIVVHGSLSELDLYRHSGPKKLLYRHLLRRGLARFSRTFSVSEALTEYLVEQHGGNRDKISLIPNLPTHAFVDRMRRIWETESQLSVRETLGLDLGRKYICYSGNAQVWQKAGLLVAAFAQIQAEAIDIDLVILTRDIKAFRKLMKDYAIDSDRVVLKTVDNMLIPDYLFACDILYLVRDQNEINKVACPTKAMEYLISGRPIVVSRQLGDISESIERNGQGFSLDAEACNDASKVAARIVEYLQTTPLGTEAPDFDSLRIENYASFFELTHER